MAYDPSALRQGDVILCVGRWSWTPGGLFAGLVRWATDSPFDHAAMATGDGYLVEALWHVTRSPAEKYRQVGWAYSVAGAMEKQRRSAVAFVEERIGDPYGLDELLADAARDILHIPLWPRVQPRRFTCSGLVAAAWQSAGVVLTWAPWPSPQDLAASPVLLGPRPWGGGGG
jgi:cell wall-associated NlpC family hydrolase